jgi:cation:H+ antiporter
MVVGPACLILAESIFVTGASGIAATLGVPTYVIGVSVVAIGTSRPRPPATQKLAPRRGHAHVGLGTLSGSHLFNGLAIVGVAAIIHPIRAPLTEVALARQRH